MPSWLTQTWLTLFAVAFWAKALKKKYNELTIVAVVMLYVYGDVSKVFTEWLKNDTYRNKGFSWGDIERLKADGDIKIPTICDSLLEAIDLAMPMTSEDPGKQQELGDLRRRAKLAAAGEVTVAEDGERRVCSMTASAEVADIANELSNIVDESGIVEAVFKMLEGVGLFVTGTAYQPIDPDLALCDLFEQFYGEKLVLPELLYSDNALRSMFSNSAVDAIKKQGTPMERVVRKNPPRQARPRERPSTPYLHAAKRGAAGGAAGGATGGGGEGEAAERAKSGVAGGVPGGAAGGGRSG